MPGRRFAFGGIFVGIIAASAGDTPMALKELEVRLALPLRRRYTVERPPPSVLATKLTG